MRSVLLGQILYRVAFSILSDTYLSAFPTSFALVYLKEALADTDFYRLSRNKFAVF